MITYIEKMKILKKKGFFEEEIMIILGRKNTEEEVKLFKEKDTEFCDAMCDMLSEANYDRDCGVELDYNEAIRFAEFARTLTNEEFEFIKRINNF